MFYYDYTQDILKRYSIKKIFYKKIFYEKKTKFYISLSRQNWYLRLNVIVARVTQPRLLLYHAIPFLFIRADVSFCTSTSLHLCVFPRTVLLLSSSLLFLLFLSSRLTFRSRLKLVLLECYILCLNFFRFRTWQNWFIFIRLGMHKIQPYRFTIIALKNLRYT
jgi:hypothetical protein